MLILVVPYQSSPQRQRLQIYLWTGVILVMYSVLLSVFRIKNGGQLHFASLMSFGLLISHHRISLQTFLVMISLRRIISSKGVHTSEMQR